MKSHDDDEAHAAMLRKPEENKKQFREISCFRVSEMKKIGE